MFGRTGDNHPMYERKHTKESIAKMSEAQRNINRTGENHPRGMLGRTHSVETLAKMSIAKGTTIYVYSSDKSLLINTFFSLSKAGEFYKAGKNTILKYAKNGKLFRGHWILSTFLIEKEES